MSKSPPSENNCVHRLFFFQIKSEKFYMCYANTLPATDKDKLTAMTFSVSFDTKIFGYIFLFLLLVGCWRVRRGHPQHVRNFW